MVGFSLLTALFVQDSLALIPLPSMVKPIAGGDFVFQASTRIHAEKPLFAVQELRNAVPGFPLPNAPTRTTNQVNFRFEQSLKPEQYILNVAKGRIDIAYGDENAALYAVQTLRQMMRTKSSAVASRVEDQPRFGWRGLMLDVSRHFFPVEVIKQNLDRMARYKLNRFHWHLVDDGGWRIELDRFPELTRKGSFRKAEPWSYSKIDLTHDTAAYGGFYTKDQVREVVAYAAERGITVIPEIEMPGHTLPSIHAYPTLGCRNAKKYPDNSWTTNVYCAGKEQTFEFLTDVLDEVLELFPSRWIHIGGDEVDKKWWRECEDCQQRIKAEKLQDELGLQSYFVRRIEKHLNAKGRSMIGWDEILEGGLAPNAAVMSWRGEAGGIEAAKSGHTVVMSPTQYCYFDYAYSAVGTESVYGWNPVPSALSKGEGEKVMGGQANVWTEWIADTIRLDQMIWPRMLAMSEVLWSSAPKDWPGFSRRSDAHFATLDALGVSYYLEEPRTECSVFFSKQAVSFSGKDFSRPVFYSLDPKAPAAEWRQVVSTEVPANRGFFLTYKRPNGTLGDIAEIYRSDRTIVSTGQGQPGLNVEFWEGNFLRCADFEKLPPKGSGIASTPGLVARPRLNDFGLRFRGQIKFPGRKLRLFLTSDDGAILRLNGLKVIDHDGGHAATTKSVGIEVADGVYDFDLSYFEGGGASTLKLEVEGSGLKRQPVPASWFSRG